MSLYAEIRRIHFREKLPISQIARKTSLRRSPIKRSSKEPERSELKRARRTPTEIDLYAAELRQALDGDAHRDGADDADFSRRVVAQADFFGGRERTRRSVDGPSIRSNEVVEQAGGFQQIGRLVGQRRRHWDSPWGSPTCINGWRAAESPKEESRAGVRLARHKEFVS